jgi:hypothetical protein
VKVDVARQVEAALNRRVNQCLKPTTGISDLKNTERPTVIRARLPANRRQFDPAVHYVSKLMRQAAIRSA